MVLPLGILLRTSLTPFQTGRSWSACERATRANHAAFFSNRFIARVVGNSTVVARVSAMVVALLSVLASWIVIQSRAPG